MATRRDDEIGAEDKTEWLREPAKRNRRGLYILAAVCIGVVIYMGNPLFSETVNIVYDFSDLDQISKVRVEIRDQDRVWVSSFFSVQEGQTELSQQVELVSGTYEINLSFTTSTHQQIYYKKVLEVTESGIVRVFFHKK